MNKKVKNVIMAIITVCFTAVFAVTGVDIFSKKIEANRPIVSSELSSSESGGESSSDSSVSGTDSSDDSPSSSETSSVISSDIPSEPSKPETSSAADSSSSKNTEIKDIPEGFFNNTLFIGDSRTVGLGNYGGMTGADFFSTVGMSVYKIHKETVNISGIGKVSLAELLKSRSYKKIYLMLGINELGYKLSPTIKKYSELVDEIRQLQPESKIILQANLHITQKRSAGDKTYNNSKINAFNEEVKKLADNKTVYYIDVNSLFDDASGSLDPKYTSDNTHILGKYYRDWAYWIFENSQV